MIIPESVTVIGDQYQVDTTKVVAAPGACTETFFKDYGYHYVHLK